MHNSPTDQLQLFADGAGPDMPPTNSTPTSQAAAASVAPLMRGRREKVYHFVRDRGEQGATRHEISEANGILIQSVCGIARQLIDAGLLFEPGPTRETPTGQQAAVLVIVPKGRGGAA